MEAHLASPAGTRTRRSTPNTPTVAYYRGVAADDGAERLWAIWLIAAWTFSIAITQQIGSLTRAGSVPRSRGEGQR